MTRGPMWFASLRVKRRLAAWDDEYLANLITGG